MYCHQDKSYMPPLPASPGFICLLFICSFLFLPAGSVKARTRNLTGGLSISLDSYDRQTHDNAQAGQQQTTLRIAPQAIYRSKSGRNFFEADLTPIFSHDFSNDQFDFEHTLSLQGHHFFTRHLQAGFAERSVRSDDATLLTNTHTPLTEEYGRKRYWSNQLDLYTDHAYGKNCNWRFDYLSDILRNDDTGPNGYEDFDRHDLGLELNHAFNGRWALAMNGHYIRGLFYPPENRDNVDDVTEHRAAITLTSTTKATRSHFITYNYTDSIYDTGSDRNLYLHELTFGGRNQITPLSTISYGIGFSHEVTTNKQGGNGYLSYGHRFRKTTIQARIEKGYDLLNFNRTGEQGLRGYRLLSASATHSFSKKLSGDISLVWRNEDRDGGLILDPYDNVTYTAGAGISYTFWSKYTMRLMYTYSGQRSDLYTDYDEQRIFCSLSMQQQILQW